MNRIRLAIKIVFTYIAVAGLVTFSLFMCEEAAQTVMFGTWPAKDTQQWHLVLEGTELMGKINFTAKVINYSLGWIQPLAFFSYRAYAKSVDYYIKTTEAQVFAHAPEMLVGRKVSFYFKPQKIVRETDATWAVSRKIWIQIEDEKKLESFEVIGYVTKKDNKIIIIRE